MEQLKENEEKIWKKINTLDTHWDWFERKYKDFWTHASEISDMFKTLPIGKEDRERLWNKFSAICEKVKQEQSRKNEKRAYRSHEHRRDILREAKNADIGIFKHTWPNDTEDMKVLGRRLKNAMNMLSERKEEMFGEHKQECFENIKEVKERHDHWWEERRQRNGGKHREFQERIKYNLEKNYARREKAANTLEKIRAHADELRDKIDSAWNDVFKERAMEWLSEEEDKIRNIEEYIEKIESWIEEDEAKLR